MYIDFNISEFSLNNTKIKYDNNKSCDNTIISLTYFIDDICHG